MAAPSSSSSRQHASIDPPENSSQPMPTASMSTVSTSPSASTSDPSSHPESRDIIQPPESQPSPPPQPLLRCSTRIRKPNPKYTSHIHTITAHPLPAALESAIVAQALK